MHVTATTVPPMCGPRNYTLVVSKRSICPSRRWLGIREVAEQLDATRQNRTAPVVLLNAGVNKGFELLDLYQIHHGHFNFTGKRWHELLLSTENPQRCLEHCCGVCSTCLKRHLTIPKPLALRQGLPVELYGFDALPANHIMLTWMVARTGLPATLTHAAVGDSVKQVLVQNESAGFENGGPLRGRRGPGPGRVPVPQLTIDAFVAQRGIEYLDHVLIDVEGWDAHVIDGMKGMLTARRIELFEFENSPKWREVDGSRETTLPYTLSGVLDRVAQLGGYHCFWHDHHGNLAEASPPCWRKELEAMHERAWRNLVCAWRPGLVASLRHLSAETVRRLGLPPDTELASGGG